MRYEYLNDSLYILCVYIINENLRSKKAIVDAFANHANSNTVVSSLMDDCRQLIIRIPQLHFSHVYREANKRAECLARLGFSLDVDFVVCSSPPEDLISVYEANCHHLYSNRLCLEPVFFYFALWSIYPLLPKKKKYCIYS